ncbi:Transposon TX1 uncharacterized 149 kDa protein [Linum grandiflorum]
MASHNKRRNFVDTLTVDGVTFEGQTLLSQAIVGFYVRLYTEDLQLRPFSTNLIRRSINGEQGDVLIRQFTIDEVERAVMNSVGDKAPGMDGFSLEFYKRKWDVLKVRVMHAFSDFHLRATLLDMVNCTFVCLIPKKEIVEDVKDFRPISLTSSLYKILPNVLMELLRSVALLFFPWSHRNSCFNSLCF